jgi:hypothetical protein
MLKRRNASKAKRNRAASIAGQETVVARLTPERDEALLRQANEGGGHCAGPFSFCSSDPGTVASRLI